MHSLDPIGLLAASLALGLTAYLRGSRWLLAVALAAFAAWMSAEMTFSFFLPFSRVHLQGTGWRFLGCAALFVVWRLLQARHLPQRRDFNGVLDGFAVHLAGIGAVLLTLPGYFDRPLPSGTLTVGIAVLAVVVLLVGVVGWRRRQKGLVSAAIVYAFIGVGRLEVQFIDATLPLVASILVTLVAAALILWRVRRRFTDRR